jgi:hypothetical protein
MSIVFLGSWLWLAALAQRRPHHSLVAPSTSAHHRRPSNIVSCLFLWPPQRRTFVLLLTSQWPRREVTQTGELRGSRLLISVPWLQGNWRALLLSDAFTMLRVSGLQRAHAASLAGTPATTYRVRPQNAHAHAQLRVGPISNAILKKLVRGRTLASLAGRDPVAVSLRGPGRL